MAVDVGNQSIALQARTFNPVSALAEVSDYQAKEMANDYTRQTQPDRIDAFKGLAKSQLAEAGASQEVSALRTTQTRQMRLANAMAEPQTADEWDAAMQQAVDDGLPEAAQYIGRYNPERQGEWVNALAASSPGSALAASRGVAATPTGDPMAGTPGLAGGQEWAARFQNMKPDELAATTAKVTQMRKAIEAVETSQDPQAEWRKQSIALGRPDMANAPDWQQKLAQLKQTVIPAYNALGGLQLQSSLGIPAAQPAAKLEHVPGVGLVAVEGDPAHPTTRVLNESVTGANGRSSVFQQKRQAWLDLHPDDPAGALDFASGKKPQGMSEAEMRKAAMAQASRDLQAASLAGDSIPDAQAFLKTASEAHFQELRASNTQPGGAPKPATPTAAGGYSGAQKAFEQQFPENKAAKAGAPDRPFYPRTEAQYRDLDQGAHYVGPDGQMRTKKKKRGEV